MTLYSKDFAKAFSGLIENFGVSCYQIHQYTQLDQAYLSRLKTGDKDNPSTETVVKIALALAHFSQKITMHDIEALFKSAGRSLFTK